MDQAGGSGMTTTIDHKGIGSIIATSRLQVPRHQRPFEWGDEQVGELIEDLQGAMSKNQQEYFLGSIVVIGAPGDERLQVLDGQQRLATVSLLMVSIADAYQRLKHQDAETAVRQLVWSYDLESGTHSPHLRLNRDDDPYYKLLLHAGFPQPSVGAPESHSLLYAARKRVDDWVKSKTVDAAAPQWLKVATKYLRESLRVIYFRVPDDSNAYLIFETLNDRGLDLSIADLLKNYLLGRAGADVESVLALWVKMLSTLKAFGYEKHFTQFLRHYWASKYDVVREKELYNKVKSRITSAANVMDIAGDLNKSSFFYTALNSADHEYWQGANDATRERIRTLALFGLEQYKPMLLAALVHFELKDVEAIVRHLESWNVRLIVVGGLGGGVMEAKYAELARGIRDGDIKNVKALTEAAQAFVPGDKELKSQFAVATVSKVALARYYLRSLELATGAKDKVEKIPGPGLTLEHVLPEKPGDNWPQFSNDEKKLYTRRLGNLTLLTHKINSELKSAPFSEKKKEYANSELKITSSLAAAPEWTAKAIEERQTAMAESAIKVWPLK